MFRPQVLSQLLTKSEDGADPTSDLPQLLTIKYHLELFFSFEKIEMQTQILFFKIIFILLKANIIQIQPHTKTHLHQT